MRRTLDNPVLSKGYMDSKNPQWRGCAPMVVLVISAARGGLREGWDCPGSASSWLGAAPEELLQRGSRLCSVPREGVKPMCGTSENQALGSCYL